MESLNSVMVLCFVAAGMSVAEAPPPYAPQTETELKPLLKITWSRGPDLPQGFQDSAVGIINNTLVTVGGFCSGADSPEKPGRYPRGFLKKVWGLDLGAEGAQWTELPDFPGAARQGLFAVSIDNALYCWAGFSYSDPYCYTNGYRLQQRNGAWVWEPLPPLPWPVSGAGACVVGSKIYAFGGADYDSEAFYTETDRHGKNPRMGAEAHPFPDPGP